MHNWKKVQWTYFIFVQWNVIHRRLASDAACNAGHRRCWRLHITLPVRLQCCAHNVIKYCDREHTKNRPHLCLSHHRFELKVDRALLHRSRDHLTLSKIFASKGLRHKTTLRLEGGGFHAFCCVLWYEPNEELR